jgi:phosphoribosylformimino-5-aminoimidazole carboxamide ribotide isomerase
MMEGPNIEATAELSAAAHVPVFASGGVTTLEDITQLVRRGIPGCIVGRALYEGRLELRAALERANEETRKRTAG